MPLTRKIDQRDIIRRFHAIDDKSRNQRQKALLLTYLAQHRGEVSLRLIEQSRRVEADILRRCKAKAAAAPS